MAIESQKDIQNFQKRIEELASKASQRNCYVYTPFLGLAEQSILLNMQRDLQYIGVTLDGGTPLCERQMARFGKEDLFGYDEPFPMVALHVRPGMKKFAEDLSHRDFLGAIMNLGIDRSTVGDIFVDDKEAILFCQESIAPFLMENITSVKHTSVVCEVADEEVLVKMKQVEPKNVTLQVASERIDAIISKLYNISRSDSLDLFRQGKVYITGRLCENNSYTLKEDETVTVRGFGKFVFRKVTGETRKKKLCVEISVFGR